MKKEKLRRLLKKHGIAEDALDVRLYIPSVDEFVYMQVGDGSQLDRDDRDENGIPYDSYIDYTQHTWNSDEFTEEDGGLYMYRLGKQDEKYGELISRVYDTLGFIYGDDEVEDDEFQVVVLAPVEE